MADTLSDAIFQVIEQRGSSLLIDKALTYIFLCVFVGVQTEFVLVLCGKFDTLFFANYILNDNGPVNDILTFIYNAEY